MNEHVWVDMPGPSSLLITGCSLSVHVDIECGLFRFVAGPCSLRPKSWAALNTLD